MTSTIYPDDRWERVSPADVGLDPEKLDAAKRQLDDAVAQTEGGGYRVVIIRHGQLAAEWNRGLYRDEKLWLASAAKAVFSSMLGLAIEEGKVPSADAKITDIFPEAMDVPPGAGPKPGRHVFEKDRAITIRQLISNTSGYMKPGEEPGQVFHYQTYGMNILAHGIATTYGLYDTRDPEGSPDLNGLIDEKLRTLIGASWNYYKMNFDAPPEVRTQIFGYYNGIAANALDMARLGWLWCNWGRWKDVQLIPEAWLREATQTAPDIRANCPEEQWKYGYGFWTNDHGLLWPHLPRDSFAAAGNDVFEPAHIRHRHIWVCPSLDLVVAQSPAVWQDQTEGDAGLLRAVVEACR